MIIDLRNLEPRPISRRTIRGSAFEAAWGGSAGPEDNTPEDETENKQQARKRRRADTGSAAQRGPKRSDTGSDTECPACGMLGHTLPNCFSIFPEDKPVGIRVAASRRRRAEKALKENADLRAQVEEIRRERKERSEQSQSRSESLKRSESANVSQ